MKHDASIIKPAPISPLWKDMVKSYQSSDTRRSVWQILNSVIPYLATLYAMYLSLSVSYWLTIGLGFVAAGFMTRVFIILHDCGHGSFFKSPRANHAVGTFCGILTHTPYHQWTREHAIHHASSGDLARRGTGDVTTLTVNEYLALSPLRRLQYRLYRNPVVMFLIGPQYVFLLVHRFTGKHSGRRERNNLWLTNLGLAVLYGAAIWAVGLKAVVLVMVPMLIIGGAWGVWLFYIQHQYDETYWQRGKEWDYATAALMGSSFYKLPKFFQWFSGNIGFHHIHHLSPRIPNYKLEECHNETPLFQQAVTFGFWESLRCYSLKLWDEEQQRMVGFGALKGR